MKTIVAIIFCFLLFACSHKFAATDFYCQPQKGIIKAPIIFHDGVYYHFNDDRKELDIIFLYSNGINRSTRFDSNHCSKNTIKETIEKAIRDFSNRKYEPFYFEEGGYVINEGKIIIQKIRYIPQFAWGIVTHTGVIINDSTFLLQKMEFPARKIERQDNMIFNFLRVTKPDSLLSNRWSKKKWYWAK
jgi:hypothetical protein